MEDREFVQYAGDYRIHDGIIEKIFENEELIEVFIRSIDNVLFKIVFNNVKQLSSNKAIGMMLYSVSEISEEKPYRQFVFINWDDEDDAYLKIISKSYEIQEII